MLHMIESDNPFDVVFPDFWVPRDIPDWYGYRNILTYLDYMSEFWLGESIGLKEISSDQVTQWAFENFSVPFGLPKMIVVDANGHFAGIFKRTF